MVQLPSLADMLQAGVHFGHQTSKWHPRMKKFIFGERQGIHVLNLEATREKLEEAGAFVKKVALRSGTVLFVGTKKQAASIVENAAKACGMPYVTKRWLGGTVTNFSSMVAVIRKFKDMKRRQEKGEYGKYTKLEQLRFQKEIRQLEEKVGGIQELMRVPEAMIVFDVRKDKTAVDEALRRGIKMVAVCDSNVDPSDIDYPIPANDDAMKAIELMAHYLSACICEGRAEWEQGRARLGGALLGSGKTEIK